MKTPISIIFFSVACCYDVSAQTVSSKKNAQITEVTEPATAPIQSSNTATLVSGDRKAVVREVPLENKPEAAPEKSEIISMERKPK